MPKISTKRVGETKGKGVVKREAIGSTFPSSNPVASTDASSNSSCVLPVVQTPEHAVSRQEAEMFLDKLARTYLMHARILVKDTLKTEPPESIANLIDPHP